MLERAGLSPSVSIGTFWEYIIQCISGKLNLLNYFFLHVKNCNNSVAAQCLRIKFDTYTGMVTFKNLSQKQQKCTVHIRDLDKLNLLMVVWF